mgnify:CR=1 FL=1
MVCRAELLSLLFLGLSRVKGHNSMVLKFPIAASPSSYDTMFAAFPNTPWVYIYRRPEEVLASMFRIAGNNPRLRAKKRPVTPPCTRTHKSGSPPAVVDMLAQYGMQPRSSDSVAYCAAYLAMLCDAAQQSDAVAEVKGGAAPAGGEHSLPPRPKAWFINYVSIPRAVLPVSRQLFHLNLSPADEGRVREEGEVYSKSRGRTVGNRQEFAADAEAKRTAAPESYHTYSAYFLYSRYAAMVERSATQPWVTEADATDLAAELQWVQDSIAKYASVVENAMVNK